MRGQEHSAGAQRWIPALDLPHRVPGVRLFRLAHFAGQAESGAFGEILHSRERGFAQHNEVAKVVAGRPCGTSFDLFRGFGPFLRVLFPGSRTAICDGHHGASPAGQERKRHITLFFAIFAQQKDDRALVELGLAGVCDGVDIQPLEQTLEVQLGEKANLEIPAVGPGVLRACDATPQNRSRF